MQSAEKGLPFRLIARASVGMLYQAREVLTECDWYTRAGLVGRPRANKE